MAQRRMIAKKITQNKKIAQLKSPWAKLLFTWMIPYTDDYGRLPGDAEMLKALIFPREHKTLRKIAELRDNLEKIGLIKIYEVDGSKYIQMLGFDEWQTLKSDRPKQKECPDIPSGNQMETKVFPKLSKEKLSKVKISKEKVKHSLSKKDKENILTKKDYYLETYGIDIKYIQSFFLSCEAKNYKYADFGKALLVWARKDGLMDKKEKDDKRRKVVQAEAEKAEKQQKEWEKDAVPPPKEAEEALKGLGKAFEKRKIRGD